MLKKYIITSIAITLFGCTINATNADQRLQQLPVPAITSQQPLPLPPLAQVRAQRLQAHFLPQQRVITNPAPRARRNLDAALDAAAAAHYEKRFVQTP